MKKISAVSFLSVLFVVLLSVFCIQPAEAGQAVSKLRAKTETGYINKNGNVYLTVKCEEMKAAGYEYGDIVKVKFLGKKLKIPFVSAYSDVDTGKAALLAREQDEYVMLAINMGDFASTYGIGVKTVHEDGTVVWDYAEGVTGSVKMYISLKKSAGYLDEYILHRLKSSNLREDYPGLSDEEFANFREITTTGMGKGVLYRASSPINPLTGRNLYADEAMKNAGVSVVLNLADDEATAKGYEGFDESYYSTTKYITLDMPAISESEESRIKLAEGLRFMASEPGVYLLHCKEGKDRAGFVSAILECLMGASLDEVVDDYMTSYYNLYGVIRGSQQYDSISGGNIIKALKKAFTFRKKDRNRNLSTADLVKCAKKYLRNIGLTNREIKALKKNLKGSGGIYEAIGYTDIAILSTTDMHGRCWDKNILTDAPERNNMLKVSTAVKQIRDEFGEENVILIDNGDLYQGTPMSQIRLQNYGTGEADGPSAMALCLKEIGYTASVLGNHEFDFEWNEMRACYDFLSENGIPVLAANICYDGKKKKSIKGENAFAPYTIKTVSINGHEHRIGILGLECCDVTRMDPEANYPGLTFLHLENESCSMAYEAGLYIPQMQEEGCEFIIVAYHGGLGDNDTELSFGVNSANQGKRIVAGNRGIDLLITGHDHSAAYSNTYIKDLDGKNVLVVNGGGLDITESVFRFTEDREGKLKWVNTRSQNLKLSGFESDAGLEGKMEPYAREAEAFVNAPVGKAKGKWDESSDSYLSQTDSMDLVLAAVMEICGSRTKGEYSGIDMAVTTVTSNGGYVVSPGDISVKDIYRLYRYENTVMVLPMTGRDLLKVMEENASDRLTVRVLDGKEYFYTINDRYTDLIFGGLDFVYDMSAPKGNRVRIEGFSNGKAFDEDEVYLVAVNDYILGNDLCGLRDFTNEDAVWSQIDEAKGETVQDIIAQYIAKHTEEEGGVSADAFTWHWELTYRDDPAGQMAYEGKKTAEYKEVIEDGHTYIIYHEASGTAVGLKETEDGLGAVGLAAYGNWITDDIRHGEVLTVTAHVDKDGRLSFSVPDGRYLICSESGALKLEADPVDEKFKWWRIADAYGGKNLLGEGTGGKFALQYYSGRFTDYKPDGTGSFILNFYEILN